MENVLGYVPEKQQECKYAQSFYQASPEKAQQEAAAFMLKYETTYPTAVECLKRGWEACLTFYNFPENH